MGVINGAVRHAQSTVLHGAKMDFEPRLRPVITDEPDDFTMTEVNPGVYTVTVAIGQTAQIVGLLKVAKRTKSSM